VTPQCHRILSLSSSLPTVEAEEVTDNAFVGPGGMAALHASERCCTKETTVSRVSRNMTMQCDCRTMHGEEEQCCGARLRSVLIESYLNVDCGSLRLTGPILNKTQ
jgi:hypothetical protein